MDDQAQAIIEVLTERGRRGELEDFHKQGESCRWCARPVRLRGYLATFDESSGRRQVVSSSATRPDGVVLKACGNRRASVCPSCASLYRSDARHLVRAGLTGEKGVGDQVVGRPAVFLTLTAPSFGAVHVARSGRAACRPGPTRARCRHGRRLSCFSHHDYADEVAGQALCPDCYDYEAAVLHNAMVPELWRRFTIYLPRALAAVLEMPQSQAAQLIHLAFCRVAEFQRRGSAHLHVVVRADGADGTTPPASLTSAQLALACRMAAAAVRASHARGRVVFGTQLDVQVLDADNANVRKVAAYLAKYATKSSHDSGALDRRIHYPAELEARSIPEHHKRLVRAAWALGAEEELAPLRLRRHAHCFGYGGLFLTKSRCYSTTFTRLRAARAEWRRSELEQRLGVGGGLFESRWAAVGIGWSSSAEARYARLQAEHLEESRRLAWEAARCGV